MCYLLDGFEPLLESSSLFHKMYGGLTWQGVGFVRDPPVYLKAGDLVEIEIDGLGKLSNPIAVEESWGGVRMS